MEENVISPPLDVKLYKINAFNLGTILGGPLVAAYLAAENYKNLGQKHLVKNAWIIGIGTTIVIYEGMVLVFDTKNIPHFIIPLIYMWTAQYLVKKYQGDAIKAHIQKGGAVYSAWRAVWIGLIGLAVIIGLVYVLITLFHPQT